MDFGEVIQTIDAMSGMVMHEEDHAGTVFRPREQGEVIGAEVEHKVEQGLEPADERGSARCAPAPSAAPLRASPAGLLRLRAIAQSGA